MKKNKNNKEIFDILFRIWCFILAIGLTAKCTINGFNVDFMMGGFTVFLIQIAFNKGKE